MPAARTPMALASMVSELSALNVLVITSAAMSGVGSKRANVLNFVGSSLLFPKYSGPKAFKMYVPVPKKAITSAA